MNNAKGGKGFRGIEEDIRSGRVLSLRCVLLAGQEEYLTKIYFDRLVSLFVSPAAQAVDCIRFDGEEAEAEDIIFACDTYPMLSEKRIVAVNGLPLDGQAGLSEKAKTLAKAVAGIGESALLLITSGNVDKRSALYKAVEKGGGAYEFGPLCHDDLASFVRRRLKDEGFGAGAGAVEEIIDVSGYLERDSKTDLFSLAGDIKNITSYAAGLGDDQVGHEHIAACMETSPETDVFAMLDAVSSGRKGEAIERLYGITGSGGSSFSLLALLISQFELMLGCLEMKGNGMGMRETMEALSIKSEYRLKKAAGFAAGYSVRRIMEILGRLYRVDQDIKSGLYEERRALVMFIAEL